MSQTIRVSDQAYNFLHYKKRPKEKFKDVLDRVISKQMFNALKKYKGENKK